MTNPWLRIPAADYEAHMRDVGQSPALRASFARLYAEGRPSRVAVLGCTTGADLALLDPAVTAFAVGVDLNAEYLAIARERLARLGAGLRLVHGDVLTVDLEPPPFDLVHAALLLEYVDPLSLLRRLRGWLSPSGVCSVVIQAPSPHAPAVSNSAYGSLQLLADRICLRDAEEIVVLAGRAGLRLADRRTASLAGGKSLVSLVFHPDVTIRLESPRQDDVRGMLRALDEYLAGFYPAESNHRLDVDELSAPAFRFFIARAGDAALGCGALRVDPEGYGELKRMYVAPAARGRRIGEALLRRIEAEAFTARLTCMRLEAGVHQPEALGLYRAMGFRERGPFGAYRDDPLSVFMEKDLRR